MKFIKESVIRGTPERVFAFHELPDALERLTPAWEKVRIIQRAHVNQLGSRAIIETRIFAVIPVRWVAEHAVYDPPRRFEDVQISGPFKSWRHRHIFEPHKEGAVLRDEIDYEVPFGLIGKSLAPILIASRLQRLFQYRHKVTREWCKKSMAQN
jgi:ligand-binding SRPBCC domain-containing protein